jgi:hypothetical protein
VSDEIDWVRVAVWVGLIAGCIAFWTLVIGAVWKWAS